jgi:hypothetical protein
MHGVRQPSEFPPLESSRIQGVLSWYCGSWNHGNPPIAEAWRPIILEIFS